MKDKSAYDIFKEPETPEQVVVMLDLALLLVGRIDDLLEECYVRCEQNVK